MPESSPRDPSLYASDHPALRRLDSGRLHDLHQSLLPMLERVRTEVSKLPRLSLPPASALTARRSLEAQVESEDVRLGWPAATRNAFQAALRDRTSAELCAHLLARVDAENAVWNAFSGVHAKEAMAEAARADISRSVGIPRGPLHGVPIAVKDNIGVAGWPRTASSLVLKDDTSQTDATVIARLRHAGAVMLGQTVMHELAFGMTSINPHLGAVRNPWDPRRICGGSSGGSAAAVAAGLVPAALGSDTGGSIRCPAAMCGIAGFKPSFGAVSRHGVVPLSYTLDTVGPMAKSAAQCLAIHEAIAGPDPLDDATLLFRPQFRAAPRLDQLRVGLPARFFEDAMEPGVRKQVARVAERLGRAGARVEEVPFPELNALNHAASVTLLSEAAAIFEWALTGEAEIGADVRGRFEQGLLISAVDYHHAQRLRARWMQEMESLFEECDLLLTPASPVVAPLIDDPFADLGGDRVDARSAISRYLRSFNFLGLPAMTLPCGTDGQGMPVAVQLVGAFAEDEFVLRASMLLEPLLEFTAEPLA
ncbi:MAG: amidase [Bryobacterales bacterium]|nr:amidase [Bryobacterales bacterium]